MPALAFLAQACARPTDGVVYRTEEPPLMDSAWLFVLIAIPSAFLLALVWAYLMRSKVRDSRTAKVYVSSSESAPTNSSGGRDAGAAEAAEAGTSGHDGGDGGAGGG